MHVDHDDHCDDIGGDYDSGDDIGDAGDDCFAITEGTCR